MQTLRIHTSINSAAAIKAIGEILISQKWKETKNQTGMERAILLPMENLKAPEVPESFRALVESALVSSAESMLKSICSESTNQLEVDAELFSRTNLVEAFMQRDSAWMTKQELELAFTASATWKRIAGRQEFLNNKTYQAAANSFKETILKLTGKNVSLEADRCDAILAKLEDSDLETSFGQFVCKRLETLKSKKPESFDFASL